MLLSIRIHSFSSIVYVFTSAILTKCYFFLGWRIFQDKWQRQSRRCALTKGVRWRETKNLSRFTNTMTIGYMY